MTRSALRCDPSGDYEHRRIRTSDIASNTGTNTKLATSNRKMQT
jgi:hypothetical protein